jgi:hypothetical protein
MQSTIEGGCKLGCLAFVCDSASVTPMSDLAGPQGQEDSSVRAAA